MALEEGFEGLEVDRASYGVALEEGFEGLEVDRAYCGKGRNL